MGSTLIALQVLWVSLLNTNVIIYIKEAKTKKKKKKVCLIWSVLCQEEICNSSQQSLIFKVNTSSLHQKISEWMYIHIFKWNKYLWFYQSSFKINKWLSNLIILCKGNFLLLPFTPKTEHSNSNSI